VRVASYNLRDLKDDVAAAARVIRAVDPDLLCLQEVPRHPLSGRQIAALAARCGLSWSGGHRGAGGTTVMTSPRVTAGDSQHNPLRVRPWQRQRGFAICQVRPPGLPALSCVSVHLGLDADERARHAAAILAALQGSGLVVVAGDLNEGPDGRAWRAIADRFRAVSGEGLTFPTRNPQHRIDAIFASAELTVVPSPALELEPADLRAATDHLPVWVDLDLDRSGATQP